MSDPKHAVILAGGKGTRLRPYTVVLPKPLMPIGDFPILEVIVRQLVFARFSRITMAVNHQAELIRAFFGDGSKWGVKIDYSLEEKPLGTMGPLTMIPELPKNFLVMNGDVLTDLDFKGFFEEHQNSDSLFTISSCVREQKIDYGVLEVNSDHELSGFLEKPKHLYEVSMGVYMLNRDVLSYVPRGENYGFDRLMLDLLKARRKIKVERFEGYWLDIGRPDDYLQAVEEFESMKSKFLK